MTRAQRTCVVLAVAACLVSPHAAHARGRVVLVIAGGISIRDLAYPGLSHLSGLLKSGSAALMNVRTAKPPKDAEPMLEPAMGAGCLTIGAGAMAAGGAEVARAANARDPVMCELLRSRTGFMPQPSNVVHPEIIKMQRINEESAYRARVGALGSALREAGIRTAAIGNSDTPGGPHREAVAAAVDERGIVDLGDVSSSDLLLPDPAAAYGVKANSDALIRELDNALPHCGFVVIDFGDTTRADSYAQFCSDRQAMALRAGAVRRLDEFLSRVQARLDTRNDLLVLLSPSSRAFSDLEEERLAPILVKGPGFARGMLTSPSTRRAGLVTLSDVAPTILRFLGLSAPTEMVGRPMRSVPHAEALAALLKLNLNASLQAQRQVAMRGSSVVQSIVVIFVTLVVLLGGAGRLRSSAGWIALVPAVLPLVMLYLPAVYSGGLAGSVVLLVILTTAVVLICARVFRAPLRALAWLCGIVAASLMVDLLRGALLISTCIAGYSPVEGARFYGIGNELMGTMLGATLVCVGFVLSKTGVSGTSSRNTGFRERLRGIAACVVFLAVFVVIGAPGLGSELGGALAAIPAFAAVLLLRRGWKPNARGLALIVLATVCALGLLFAADALRGGSAESHVGRFLGRVTGGGISELFSVFGRKFGLNFMLVSTSLWSRLLGLSLLGSLALWWYGRRTTGSGFLNVEQSAAAAGCTVGTVGAFLFNDSGVVAAAACAVLLWCLLALVFEERCRRTGTPPPGKHPA